MLIEVVADFVCPWCYVGMLRFERALRWRPNLPVVRRYVPFQLNRDLPPEGIDRSLFLAIKYGGRLRARQVYAMVQSVADLECVPLRLDLIRRMPNTANAHRLVGLAADRGCADALVHRLFAAHFVEGRDLSDGSVLLAVAQEVGLNPLVVRRFLASGKGLERLRGGERLARRLDLNAVPVFIFQQRYALSGAQEAECFLPLLDILEADAAMTPVTSVPDGAGPDQ